MSLIDFCSKLLNNETNTDVSFVFTNTNTKYNAHKLILTSRSDVFGTMFYGEAGKSTTNWNDHITVHIIDIYPHIFLELLRFIYTDHINLDEENFGQITYAAEKYNVKYFDDFCVRYLKQALNKYNVSTFL